jgi:hypothetical protein
MQQGKKLFGGLNQLQASAISAAMMAPLTLSMAPGGIAQLAPPPFNIIISNVPGPKKPLYFNGARLTGIYPLSIPTNYQALNITVTSYVDNMEFGLIGCRRSVPHLQRLLTHLDDSLAELVKVTGAYAGTDVRRGACERPNRPRVQLPRDRCGNWSRRRSPNATDAIQINASRPSIA